MVCGSRVLLSALALWSYILTQHVVFASSNSSIYIVQQSKKNNKPTSLSTKRQSSASSTSVKRLKKTARRLKTRVPNVSPNVAEEPYFYDDRYAAVSINPESFHRSRHRNRRQRHRAQYSFANGAQFLEPEHAASELIHFHQPEAHFIKASHHDGGEYLRPRQKPGFSHRLDFFGVENPWALFGIVASMLLTLPLLKAVITYPLASVVNNIGRLVYLAYLNRNGTTVLGFRDAGESDLDFDRIALFGNITRGVLT